MFRKNRQYVKTIFMTLFFIIGISLTNVAFPTIVLGQELSSTYVSTGYYHNNIITKDGELWGWGWNEYGQMGDTTKLNKFVPVLINNMSDIISTAEGRGHTLLLKRDGTVWAWGLNDQGQLGDETFERKSTPVQVKGLNNIVKIAAGEFFSLALESNGTVWAWGINTSGQLGQLGNKNVGSLSAKPYKVTDLEGLRILSDVKDIAAGGGHALALKNDGTVVAWGQNDCGQLGDESYIRKRSIMSTCLKATCHDNLGYMNL